MRVTWSREASENLAEIEDFIAKDSAERAAKFIDEIAAHTESALSGEPRSGRTVPEISNPEIRELLFKKYRIVYRVKKNTVEILTVFEGHRLLRVDEIGR
jgi:plasmid stabilization system protein ParE